MARRRVIAGGNRDRGFVAPALVAVAAVLVGLPTAGLAVTATANPHAIAAPMMQFTPANVDPSVVRRIAERVAARGQSLRFTPAGATNAAVRTVTVAIRVDERVARAIEVRSAIAAAKGDAGLGTTLTTIAPTRYNLGIARGYRSFAQPAATTAAAAVPAGTAVANFSMPDLANYSPHEAAPDKPGRLQGNLVLESASRAGRSPRTLESGGAQAVDLSAGYRLSRSLNVTAGVRLSQDRDRLAPLTDSQRDDQAVYVGTQFRF